MLACPPPCALAPCACRPHFLRNAERAPADDRRHRHRPRLRCHRRHLRDRSAAEIAADPGAGRLLGRMVRPVQDAGADPGKARGRLQRRVPPGEGRCGQGAAACRRLPGALDPDRVPGEGRPAGRRLPGRAAGRHSCANSSSTTASNRPRPTSPRRSRRRSRSRSIRTRRSCACAMPSPKPPDKRRAQARPGPGPARAPARRRKPNSCSTPCPPTSPPTTAPSVRGPASASSALLTDAPAPVEMLEAAIASPIRTTCSARHLLGARTDRRGRRPKPGWNSSSKCCGATAATRTDCPARR